MILKDTLFTLPQYIIPQHLLSRVVLKFTRLKLGGFTHWLIKRFIKLYKVNMDIVESANIHDYSSFNQFFTRKLKTDARPLAATDVISPVDAQISQIGQINNGSLIQAKGREFQLDDLLAGQTDMVNLFKQSLFTTLYLAPKDYHRIHMPITGRLTDMVYVPGRLFSVNQRTSRAVPNLFARNERVICLFETELGPMAMILVGALFVGSIETVWAGTVAPSSLSKITRWNYSKPALEKGAEMGRFNMGSTVIILHDAQHVAWLSELKSEQSIKMGEGLAQALR